MSQDKLVKTIEVYETTDYAKFSFVKGNRKTRPGHVRSIQLSMLKHGNRMIDEPAEVTKDFKLHDGQHRFEACKSLGYPFSYTFRDNSTVPDIRVSNAYRENWNWRDFATSYRDELNNAHYRQFMELVDEFGYNFRILLAYCTGVTSHSYGKGRAFLDGDFVMNDYEKTSEQLQMYSDIVDICKIRKPQLAIAVYKFINTSTYDHARMLGKVLAHKTALNNCYTENDFLYTLQDIWRA